eukprot:IDg21526t1
MRRKAKQEKRLTFLQNVNDSRSAL